MIWGKDFGQLLTGTASRNWKLACSKTVNQIQNTFDSWILTRPTVLADLFFVCAGVVDDNCSLVFHPSSGPCKQQIRGYLSQQLTIHLWAINGSTSFHMWTVLRLILLSLYEVLRLYFYFHSLCVFCKADNQIIKMEI